MRDGFSEWTISPGDVDARVARAIRLCVGNSLREIYGEAEPIPPMIAGLLRRLEKDVRRLKRR
jgi:hypothetical protein